MPTPSKRIIPLNEPTIHLIRGQLTVEELSKKHGRRCYLPWAFSEHGAIMLATVLNSDGAVQASVRVGRAFVGLREMVAGNAVLAAKLAELERRLDSHGESIANLFQAIRQLLTPPPKPKREVGFHVREGGTRYHIRETGRM